MGLFRRKDRAGDEPLDEPLDDAVDPADDAGGEVAQPAPGRPRGPWDADDAPEGDGQRLDLGALRVPLPPQTEVRVEVGQDGRVVAATLVRGASTLQVSAFAAPRTEGIWDEVREEIAAALRESGGSAQDVDGAFGTALRAVVPTDVPNQGRVMVPARFVGVDGPRWFLRGMITGPAASEPEPAAVLEQAFRGIVVVRGTDPMAVRDPLPLRLPKDVEQAAQRSAAAAPPAAPSAAPPAGA